MQVRILGAHQSETAAWRFTSILVDGVLALDAGGLAATLTLEEQLALRAVLLSHHHWDHLKDLPALGYTLVGAASAGRSRASLDVYCTEEVRQVIADRLLREGFWMDFFRTPSPDDPAFRHQPIEPCGEIVVGPYQVRVVPTLHSVPTVGFEIVGADGARLYYTGDNGAGCGASWATTRPDVLVTECTYSDERRQRQGDHLYGHLCPAELATALQVFRAAQGYLPRVVVVHVNPFDEPRIRAELAQVARDLGAAIDVASEGTTVAVSASSDPAR